MSKNTNEPTSSIEPVSIEPITRKDPRRVEQGKRLAAISKAAKEKKLREKIELEIKTSKSSETTSYRFLTSRGLLIAAPFISFVVYKLFTMYNSEKNVSEQKEPEKNASEQKEPEQNISEQKEEKTKFETLG